MLTNRKKMLGAAAFAAMLAGGGVAGAALGAPIVAGAQDETDATPDDSDVFWGWHPGHDRGEYLDVAAETLGVTADELREALRDDQTIADVAEEHGVEVQSVVDALVAAASERITKRADAALEALPERMTDLVNGDYPDYPDFGRPGRPHFGGPVFGIATETAAESLGISTDELRDALRDGQSIAEVAEAEGVEVQSVIDTLVTAAESRIDEAVADGDLDTDRAGELKTELTDHITDAVNDEGLRRGPFGFGGHRHRD